jgi:hypothetical protein
VLVRQRSRPGPECWRMPSDCQSRAPPHPIKVTFAADECNLYSQVESAMVSEHKYDRHEEATAEVAAEPGAVFDFLDDHANLSSHMARRSWMMLGTRMDLFMDDGRAKAVGSRFGFSGRVLGLPLRVEQRVSRRQQPLTKVWETGGIPRLWVIGAYQMGFEICPSARGAKLRVFLDYSLPGKGFERLIGKLVGPAYGRWCVGRMVSDAVVHFRDLRPK